MRLIHFFIVCALGCDLKAGQNFVSGIKWSHSEHVETPITVVIPPLATRIVSYTGKSVETIANPKTKEIMTGGILGNEKFQFHSCRFYWENCDSETRIRIRFVFYNTKYASFQDALKYADGILQIYVPVETNGCVDNPVFSAFEEIFKKHIKKPGEYAYINSFFSCRWYNNFNYKTVYKSYHESYYDEVTGETAPNSLVIECPKESGKNFISSKQYADTFGSLVDYKGQIVENPPPKLSNHLSSAVESKGLCVVFA